MFTVVSGSGGSQTGKQLTTGIGESRTQARMTILLAGFDGKGNRESFFEREIRKRITGRAPQGGIFLKKLGWDRV